MGFRILNVMIFSNMVGKFEKFVKITRRVEKYSNPIVKFLKLLVTSKKRNFTKEKKKSVFGNHGGIERHSPFLENHFEKEGSKYTFKYGKSKFFDG